MPGKLSQTELSIKKLKPKSKGEEAKGTLNLPREGAYTPQLKLPQPGPHKLSTPRSAGSAAAHPKDQYLQTARTQKLHISRSAPAHRQFRQPAVPQLSTELAGYVIGERRGAGR